MGYLYLSVAIICGITANSLAKISDGFSKLGPSIACIILMCVTMFTLARSMSLLPVGFSYATYSGITLQLFLFLE